MKIAVTCPQCGSQHQVDAALAGTKAHCRCGTLLKVPGDISTSTVLIVVQCSSCSRRYAARASLAGSQTRCACGVMLTIAATGPESASAIGLPAALPAEEFSEDEAAVVEPVDEDEAEEEPQAPWTATPAASPASDPLMEQLLAADAEAVSRSPIVLGPLWRQRRFQMVMTWFCLVAGVAAVAALLVATVVSVLGLATPSVPPGERPVATGPLGPYSWCIPPHARGLATVNLERVRQNAGGLFASLSAVADQASRQHGATMASPVSGTPFFQNLAEIDLTLTSEGRPITIWRSQVDLPLEELANLLSPPDANPVPTAQELVHEYRGVTYQTLPSLNVLAAQIAPNAFCVAEREKDLCEALKRWEQGRVARLETPLRTVWEKTQGDARLAITDTGADPGDPRWEIPKLPGVTGTGTRFPRPDWAGLELTCGDSLELQMMAGFFSEADAALGETAVRDAVAPLAAQAEQLERDLQRLPAELQPPVQAAQDLGRRLPPFFAAMMMSRHGVQVQVRGSWSMEDAEEVVRLIVVIQEALQDASR